MARLDPPSAPFILGLTGPIASGKTTAGNILLELGALERIDADAVVHSLMEPGTDTARQIADTFGPEMLRPDGSVDRSRLGALVFGDPEKLRQLEAITHPEVRSVIRTQLEALVGEAGIVVVDAVKLLQSDLLELCGAVWVVRSSAEAQLARLTGIRGMSEKQARARLAAQPSFDDPRVTAIIENSGSVEELRARIVDAWPSIHAGDSA